MLHIQLSGYNVEYNRLSSQIWLIYRL